MSLGVLGWKLVIAASLFVTQLIFGLLPLLSRKTSNTARRDTLLALGNSFGGGLFLGVGFIHLLSEAQEGFQQIHSAFHQLPTTLACIGILVAFLFENVVFVEYHKRKSKHDEPATQPAVAEKSPLYHHDSEADEHHDHAHQHDHHNVVQFANDQSSVMASVLLIIVLSFHNLSIGFVIGLERSIPNLVALFIATATHKWVEAFALGVTILKVDNSIWDLVTGIGVTSAMCPMAIGVGLIAYAVVSEETKVILSAVASGVGAGLLIYVALCDILMDEFRPESNFKFLKFFCVVLGVVLSVLAAVFTH